jgi:hypothetical protein
MSIPMSLVYTIRRNEVVVEDKTFTKSRCKFKGRKLFSKSGWVAYSMFYVDDVKYELSAQFKVLLK